MPLLCSIFMAPAICWRKSLMVSSLSVRIAREEEKKWPQMKKITVLVLWRAQRADSPQQLAIMWHLYFYIWRFFSTRISEWFLQATRESVCVPSLLCGQSCFQPRVSHGELRPVAGARSGLSAGSRKWHLVRFRASPQQELPDRSRQALGRACGPSSGRVTTFELRSTAVGYLRSELYHKDYD